MNKFIWALVLAASSVSAMAADLSNGADNFFKSGKVVMEKATFKNQYKMNVAGNLFIPDNLNRNTTSPAIIVGNPMGAVKEQRKKIIAEAAEHRYVESTGGKTRYAGGTVHELKDDTHPIQREFFP